LRALYAAPLELNMGVVHFLLIYRSWRSFSGLNLVPTLCVGTSCSRGAERRVPACEHKKAAEGLIQ